MATKKYKVTYRDPKSNPFATTLVPTKTVEVDASIPFEEVEVMARESAFELEFVKLEVVQ
jgi:hypothetical protein